MDDCVEVSDTYAGGTSGSYCASAAPVTFYYSRTVGPYDTCGSYTVDNTATLVTDDTGTTLTSSVNLPVDVPCAGGCTLTQGYWKTHSDYGPAPYDATWAAIGEDTSFYLSGKSWYEVLWTPPAGDAYYNLAHQYIGVKSNVLNGASTNAQVDAALALA